jgi:hypothetical protein
MRDRSIGWDGEIAAYANDRHRHIFDAKGLGQKRTLRCRHAMSAYPSKADVRCDEFVAVFPPQPTFLQYYDFYVGV